METENSLPQNAAIEASIASVTVYSDRAQIVRRARVQLEAGARDLTIADLPAELDLNSLRAKGSGEVAVKILGVESREVFLTEENHQAARDVQQELDVAEAEGAAIASEDEVLQHRLATIEEMASSAAKRYAQSLADGRSTLASVGELLDYLQAQSMEVHQARAALETRKRENAAQQVALQNRLQQLRSARTKKAQSVSVLVESSGAGAWDLELSYVVPGASWKPLYDARVSLLLPSTPEDELTGKLSLSYLASITQRTGEDWNDVAVSLSTARPNLGSLPPKLTPIYVDVQQQYASGGAISRARAQAGAGEDSDVVEMLSALAPAMSMPSQAAPTPIQAQIETAEVQSEGATVVFQLPRRLSVPSDGQPHRAPISNPEFSCKLDYVAIPRRSEWAYLRATVQNESALSLLRGEASIFRDEMFIGKTALKNVAPGEEWQMFLGPDEQVKARHELTRRDVEKNLMGNVRYQTFGYKIEIENLKAHRVQLELLDQIPVSRHEQIKVKLKNAQPQPQADEMGILKWELALASQAKRELIYESVVESPRDVNLVGLNE